MSAHVESDDELEQLRSSVRRYFEARASIAEYVRPNFGMSPSHDAAWAGLAELGVIGLLAPAAVGGSGAGMTTAAIALEECGRAVYPGAVLASAIGAITLLERAATAAQLATFGPGLADGTTIGTLAAFEPGLGIEWNAPAARLDATSTEADCTITGTKRHVLHGAAADLFLTTARDERGGRGDLVLAAVPAGAGVRVEADDSIDGTRPTATVHFDAAPATMLDGGDAHAAVAAALDRLRTALALDAVGAADRALELSVEYAKVRVAFDRPIGSFQAIQHLCADMLRAVELARTAAHHACRELDHGSESDAHLAVVQAAAFACEELPRLGASAIQIFGGVGYTWEHDIHLFYKRLLSAGALLGTADDHLAELADLVLDPRE